jgi:hypothetical protein
MGFLHSGPFGSLNGRTGNNVGRWTKGKNVFSIRPHKSSKKATQAQLDVRAKFTLMAEFLSFMAPLIDVGFSAYDATMSPMNAAIGYNIQKAIIGVSPNYAIDYPRVIFSRGTKVNVPIDPLVTSTTPANIDIVWDPTFTLGTAALADDLANFLVYDPETQEYVVLNNAALRSEGSFALQVPAHFAGDLVHCYMSFVSKKGKVSKSIYLGNLNVL